jgi:fumarate reductase subunit C
MSVPQYSEENKGYRRPMPRTWWLRNPRYTLFMLREASSIIFFVFMILYIIQLALLAAGPGPYDHFVAFTKSPPWIALHVIFLIFAVVHTVTWFSLVPVVSPIRFKGKEVPGRLVLMGALVAWVVVSVGIGFVILKG